MFERLTEANVATSDINGLEECFTNSRSPFSSLETQYQQRKYFIENFNLIVSVYVPDVCLYNI